MTAPEIDGRPRPESSRDAGLPRIIAAANGSDVSYGAVRWARCVAGTLDASVTVVDAYDRDDREMDVRDSVHHLDEIRSRLSRHLDEHGLHVDEVVVARGDTVDVVARTVDDNVAMIVLGSHSNDGWHAGAQRGLILALARQVRCPIIVVPPGDWFDGGVMVGIDGSEANRSVFRWACWLAERLSCPTLAVHVSDPLFRTFGDDDRLSPEDLEARREIELSEAEFVELVASEPDRSLAEYALIRSASLLVVGARVRHSMGGRLVGGVAEGVIDNCRCPFAVIPRVYQLDHA